MIPSKTPLLSIIWFFLFVLIGTYSASSQVLIGDPTGVPDSSAVLELRSTSKGLLPPRMTENQIEAIVNPTPGLIVYCTDCKELQVFNDTAWTNFLGLPTQPGFQCGEMLSYESQEYTTMQFGTQCWMTQNLDVGTMINSLLNPTDNDTIEKYCYLDLPANCTTYGGLYRLSETMQYIDSEAFQGICPNGWHIPTDEEFKTLEMHLGMTQEQADAFGFRGTNEGSKLATDFWVAGALVADPFFDTSGFKALSTGTISNIGVSTSAGFSTYYWSSTTSGNLVNGIVRNLSFNFSSIGRENLNFPFSLSVRCIED